LPPCAGIARWLAPAKRERRLGSFSLELGGTEDFGYSAHAACGASGASDQNIQELCATSLVACYGQREDSTRKHRRKSLIQFPPMMMLLIGMTAEGVQRGQREDSTRKHRRKSLIQFPPMMMLLIGTTAEGVQRGQREDSTRKHRRKSLIQFPPMMMLLIGMKTNFTVYIHYIAKTAFE
jgi:hypothetical protein